MREIKIGYIYKHFKGGRYIVLDIVNDSEGSRDGVQKKTVIYQALYGDREKWARSLEMFASEVDHEKYPEVEQKWRFEEMGREGLKELS